MTADAELLAVAIDMLRGFGLTQHDVRARVSDRRLLAALLARVGVTDDQMSLAYAVIDKVERDPREVLLERLANAGMAADVAEQVLGFARLATVEELRASHGDDPDVAEQLDRFTRYMAHLNALGVADWVVLDLTIVRGLAYYTGIVFELFDLRGEFRAICGGGRYDTLLQALGGADLPALGFGMGDVVLGELLKARGLMPASDPVIDYWIAVEDPDLLPVAQSTASLLRRLGHSIEYPLREQALTKQLKAAVSAGARAAVILRRDALAGRGEIVLRSLTDGHEESLELGKWLEERIAAAGGPGTDGVPPAPPVF